MKKFIHHTEHYPLIALTLLVASTAIPAVAYAQMQDQTPTIDNETIELTTTIEDLADQSPIVLTGLVGDIRDDEFNLYYGADTDIIVELDRFNWSDDATDFISQGENVTVHGFIDDDLFEGREIEAYDLYIHERSTYYQTTQTTQAPLPDNIFGSEIDLEDGAYISVTGTVSDISAAKFDITTANGYEFMVDSKDLVPPLRGPDGTSFIAPGDRVNVRGNYDMRYHENKTIYADRVTKLIDSGITTTIED